MFDVSPTAGMVVGSPTDADPERMVNNVCAEHEVRLDAVRGARKDRRIMAVRRRCAAVLRDAGCSLVEIGRLINRHHTSVRDLLAVE